MTSELTLYRPGEVLDLNEHDPSIAGAIRWGALVILLAFGGAFTWSFLAMLDSAAHARGLVVVDGHRKTVQHLEGGIVAELKVRDGEVVKAGQVLLRLDGAQSRATLEELTLKSWTALVRVARLRAEQAGQRTFLVPQDLADGIAPPATTRALEVQQRLFGARWHAYDGDIVVLREQHRQELRERQAHLAQERSAVDQIAYTQEELVGVEELVSKQLERKPRLLALKRDLAKAIGARDEARARIAQSEQAMAVIDVQIGAKEKTRLAEISTELEQAQSELDETMARIKAARDAVTRTEIRAPVDGRVVSLAVFTLGGVIKEGESIMEIVPANEALSIEVRVQPTDIDVVRAGQTAQIQLTAYKQRRTPTIDATVVDVSADRLTDAKTGEPYFVARVRPEPAGLLKLEHVQLAPGMPAEVLIATGERRAIDYFIAPIRDAMTRSLIED